MNKQAYETAVGRVLSKKAVDWSSVWESIKSGSGKAYDALKKNIQENPAAYIGGAGGALIGAGTGAVMKGLKGGAVGGATGALLGALGGAGVDKYRDSKAKEDAAAAEQLLGSVNNTPIQRVLKGYQQGLNPSQRAVSDMYVDAIRKSNTPTEKAKRLLESLDAAAGAYKKIRTLPKNFGEDESKTFQDRLLNAKSPEESLDIQDEIYRRLMDRYRREMAAAGKIYELRRIPERKWYQEFSLKDLAGLRGTINRIRNK